MTRTDETFARVFPDGTPTMGTESGQHGDLSFTPHHEKPVSTELTIDSIVRIVCRRPDIHWPVVPGG
jgi:hypothetical protein